jgi:hypothetical protein
VRALIGKFTENELAPEDVVLHRVGAILKANPKLISIFGAPWIKVTDVPDFLDHSHLPVLYVSPFFSSSEPMPSTYSLDFRLYITIRYEQLDAKELKPGQPTIATLARVIHQILETGGNKNLNVPKPGGGTHPLVRRNVPGPIRFQLDPHPQTGRVTVSQIIERNFTATTDPESGRILNQVIAEQG